MATLTCLQMIQWRRPGFNDEDRGYHYAYFHWPVHVSFLKNQEGATSKEQLDEFLTPGSGAFSRWSNEDRYDHRKDSSLQYRIERVIVRPPHPLLLACDWGFERCVARIIRMEDGEAVSSFRNNRGITALAFAATRGFVSVVQQLLGAEASWEQQQGSNARGRSSILRAVALDVSTMRTVDGAEDFLGRVHNPLAESRVAASTFHSDALHAASVMGHLEVVQTLLVKSAQINAPKAEINSALFSACCAGKIEIVKALLDEGADVNATSGSDSMTTLYAASVKEHNVKIVRMIIDKGVDPNAYGGEYGYALQAASHFGNEETVQALLDGGADPNAYGGEYGYALSKALSEGSSEIAEQLLDGGANTIAWPIFNIGQNKTFENCLSITQMLIKKDVKVVHPASGQNGEVMQTTALSIDQKDSYGRTLLSFAARHKNAGFVSFLLDRDDVEADSRDAEMRTPLSYAAEWGRTKNIKLLVDRDDVEADSRDSKMRTPLLYVAIIGRAKNIKLLADRDDVEADSRDTKMRTPLSYAASSGVENIKFLVDRDDVEADSRDSKMRTPLSYAAGYYWNTDNIKLLVDRDDVEADSRDSEMRTPLSYAAEWVGAKNIKLLVDRDDVEADSRDLKMRIPLLYATEY